MDFVYWIIVGALAALLAKMQFPAERDEAIGGLLVVGIAGALIGGFLTHSLARTGFMSQSFMSFVVAFAFAVVLLLIQRQMTRRPT